jgi:nucleotide-binding universal stress UspA family protein
MVLAMDIKNSRAAVRHGVSLARKYGAELFILHAVHDPFGAEGWNLPFLSVDEDYKNVLREAKEELGKIIRAESEKGLPVTEMIKEGEPVGVVFKAVGENRIDLLLVPAHEEGRLEHFLFSRTTDAIIRKMPCSILLVKTEPRA